MSDKQPSGEFQLPAELAALEQQLAELAPSAVRVDRDRLMFAAGRAAATAGDSLSVIRPGPRSGWFWPAATAMMTAASVLLAATLAWQTNWRSMAAKPAAESVAGASDDAVELAVESGVVEFDQFAADRGEWPWSARPSSGYLALRYVALTEGVAAIASRPPATNGLPDQPPPATARELLKELLPAAGRTSS